jgi:sporulation protein YlmC with PRC-barrel domain
MSSEQRMKKLRGSGGYVMASVNDDQQRKGNLGGPDLFLAPIGRLESDKISRYFCNTCEKDYEGCPKIDFENPNEEVAENLVLAERGQYVCSTCGSTIAEYRAFQKHNELGEVGLAKPVESSMEQTFDAPAQSFSQEASDTSFVEPPPITAESAMPQFEVPQSTDSVSNQVQSNTSITSIVGMSVFNEDGVKVGTAKQVGVDHMQSVVLVVTQNDGNELAIPWNQIKKVGEIVLLGGQSGPQIQSNTATQASGGCSNCGFVNKMGSKFCEQCGNQI